MRVDCPWPDRPGVLLQNVLYLGLVFFTVFGSGLILIRYYAMARMRLIMAARGSRD